MRIYFSGSISGGRELAHFYPEIIEQLKRYGEVLTEFVGDQQQTEMGESSVPPADIYQRDMNYIDLCDVVVAEVSIPSFGVGVEIAHADIQKKPVLALHQPQQGRRLSAMITGDPNVTVVAYHTISELVEAITQFFDGLVSLPPRS